MRTRTMLRQATGPHNGYDASRFRVIQDREILRSVAQCYGLPARFVLWVGQIERRKNIERLLRGFARAAKQIPQQLVIAGVPGARCEVQLVCELGLQGRVHLAGWVLQGDLPALYNLAELFLLPSLHGGFGIRLLEAMACGCPIVTSGTCAPREVTRGAALLVDPLDVDSIGWAVEEVLRNEELRTGMIASGLDRCRDFSGARSASELLGFLEPRSGCEQPVLSASE